MDFDQMGKAGTMLGSGGIVVLDETVCMVEFALRTMQFYQHESCGWCIPCREGTDWLKKSLVRLHAGGAWIRTSTTSAISPKTCWVAPSARSATRRRCRRIAFVKKFRKEFEDHLNGKGCPYQHSLEREAALV